MIPLLICNFITPYYFNGIFIPVTNYKQFIELIYIFQNKSYIALAYKIAYSFSKYKNYNSLVSYNLYIDKFKYKNTIINILLDKINSICNLYKLNKLINCYKIETDNKLDRYIFTINDNQITLQNICSNINIEELELSHIFYQKIYSKCNKNTQLIIKKNYINILKKWTKKFIKDIKIHLENTWVSILFLNKYNTLDINYNKKQMGKFNTFIEKLYYIFELQFSWFIDNNYKFSYSIFKKLFTNRINYISKIKCKQNNTKLSKYILLEKNYNKWLIFAITK